MNIEGYIGTFYCLVGLVHLVTFTVKRHRDRNYEDPEMALVVTVAWPLVDVLWLLERKR